MGYDKLENAVCAGNWTWPSSSRRWYGTECNLGVTSLAFLRHLDYFCFLCSTDLFNKYLLMVFFVQRTVWECEEKCGVLHFVVYVEKRTWVCATSGVCAMVNAIKVARTSCWWSKRKSSLFGGFRPWLTLFFLPRRLSYTWTSLRKSTSILGGKRPYICKCYFEKHCVQKEKCHIGPQKTGCLPQLWFQHTCV